MNKKYFFVDSILIGLLAASGISGFLLWTLIPRRTTLRRFMKDSHIWSGIGLTILASYHLILHWDWYAKMTKKIIAGGSVKIQ
ncbi:DUF4405 domain-containing protein [Pelotomaculum propionicicum]|uniref:Flavinylation-associated cytochrome domain-containing protein n=1 Tax=Pelotomaculum propionicicum TaxID=258475 RepID=A0A4Y7RU71_9FIRM|nr:DUF4405 domain-containing protein [Peptococcaceae bacterium]TEB12421.1 hypothetical protein Pmgp_01038 [Pelotomaculum propionicicum]